MRFKLVLITIWLSLGSFIANGQGYFLDNEGPFNPDIPSPEAFLGYPIGSHHSRHDQMVAYLQMLSDRSDRAKLITYGKTYEHRPLVMLVISQPAHLQNLDQLQKDHLKLTDPNAAVENTADMPVFVNLGYGVHGNEPSSGEAALLTAYTLVASEREDIKNLMAESVTFIDPAINPDGRDRHTHWANMYKGSPLVADPDDAEHNEYWPRGRTNHYWFDLNRDWLLGVHPESRGKLKWYHEWYPNVVTDYHEMGTNSTYFFEPMKANASKDPIMPKENYTKLNDLFATYYQEALNNIGSLYFTKEVFDGTYPGYGSSYPDLQGALALLFEQASSRGHLQDTPDGKLDFAFTIRNQYQTSLATLRAAVENKETMHNYLKEFFRSAISRADKSAVKAYVFGGSKDFSRTAAFIDKLLLHGVAVYPLPNSTTVEGRTFSAENSFIIPTSQPQYRMVQSFFETYKEYTDSVFYDASAWSVANFYNMPYAEMKGKLPDLGEKITADDLKRPQADLNLSNYAYLIPWYDYKAPAALNYLQENGLVVKSAFKPFSIPVNQQVLDFGYGTLMVPVALQNISGQALHTLLKETAERFGIEVFPVSSGYASKGIDLGSRYFQTLQPPRALMLIGEGTSSYEAGEVWYFLDQQVNMPITKVHMRNIARIDWQKYNTLVMVSGSYNQIDSVQLTTIKQWLGTGNTLVAIRTAAKWAIENKLVNEQLYKPEAENSKDGEKVARLPYVDAPEIEGKEAIGGVLLAVDLDLTHPLAFGYEERRLAVYRNSSVFLSPSKNAYATVAKYTASPHIDGFITEKNLEEYVKPSASLIVSPVGRGRAILFADNPNFRGSWLGTNKLFLNALFFGDKIQVP